MWLWNNVCVLFCCFPHPCWFSDEVTEPPSNPRAVTDSFWGEGNSEDGPTEQHQVVVGGGEDGRRNTASGIRGGKAETDWVVLGINGSLCLLVPVWPYLPALSLSIEGKTNWIHSGFQLSPLRSSMWSHWIWCQSFLFLILLYCWVIFHVCLLCLTVFQMVRKTDDVSLSPRETFLNFRANWWQIPSQKLPCWVCNIN